jgi:hypothetical protein
MTKVSLFVYHEKLTEYLLKFTLFFALKLSAYIASGEMVVKAGFMVVLPWFMRGKS